MTYQLNPAAFDPALFLANDWQQQPRVFRQAFVDFVDPIDGNELAGVALEPGVDSRLISCAEGQWDLRHGPIEDFSDVPEDHWSLLVQAVNEHFPPAQALLDPFRFIADWRIDDLMVSYSTPGGGVGPHLDQYDVFIIQGEGRRRWQIGARGDYASVTPHPELKQIEGFEALIDVVLEPGDMIYIPAGVPHTGESLTECMNYSVGFRAPSQAELISALADYALDNDALTTRYRDPTDARTTTSPSWHIDTASRAHFRKLIRDSLADDALLDKVVAQLLSQNPRPPLLVWPQEELTGSGVLRYIERSGSIQRAVGLRMLTSELNHELVGLVQGQVLALDEQSLPLFERLIDTPLEISSAELKPLLKAESARQLMLTLLNEGYWFAAEAPDES